MLVSHERAGISCHSERYVAQPRNHARAQHCPPVPQRHTRDGKPLTPPALHSQPGDGDEGHLRPGGPHVNRVAAEDFPAAVHTHQSYRGPNAPACVVEEPFDRAIGCRRKRQTHEAGFIYWLHGSLLRGVLAARKHTTRSWLNLFFGHELTVGSSV